jgi:mycothione reductase
MQHVALAVIGSGSGNAAIPDAMGEGEVALIECSSFGGTCVNRGCIPSKMLLYTADLATMISEASQFGLSATLDGVDWRSIQNRVFSRTDETSQTGRKGRIDSANITVYEGRARFVGPRQLVVNDRTRIEAQQVVIATGGRPTVPHVVLDSGVSFQTSDTVMRLESLPASMVILGGGYVAVEMAHLFSSLGVEIHVVEKAGTLLAGLDADISRRFTATASARWDVQVDATVSDIRNEGDRVEILLRDGRRVAAELLLVATGRQPNTDNLGLDLAGVSLAPDGRVIVDEFGRAAAGVWALGDCSSAFELKHVANAEARIVAHNLAHPDDLRPLPHDWVPFAVFSEPQIASVGARSQDLDDERPYVEAIQEYRDVAYGWAMQDHRGVCRLYADPETGTLLGAHILGYQASLLITPLIQAVSHGQRVADLARGQYWIHPALSEVVENALLKLPVDKRVTSGQTH